MKRILIISAWTILAVAIIFLTGFAIHRHDNRTATAIDIDVEESEHFFVSEDDVKTILVRNGFAVSNQVISQIDIPTIEQVVLADPSVEGCEACITVDGKVVIRVKQRRPIAHFVNLAGESFYIDDRGKLMPAAENYTAPVMIVNGYFADSYNTMKDIDFNAINADSALKTSTPLDDAWHIVRFIDADSFLRAQMVQLYLTADKDFELIPRVGDHKIIFGHADGIEGKFRKLNLFYVYGLGKTGRWSEYASIDLRYQNQIVCTKKPITNGI